MRKWLAACWRFLRELSGEAALERRMQAYAGHTPACAAKHAMAELAGERSRCC